MLNERYKLWHKPNKNNLTVEGNLKKGGTHQGYYKVSNKEKYLGNPELIIYRSSWEFSFCKWCDFSPSIIRWSSEPIRIPYYDRTSKLGECEKLGLDPNNPKNWITKFYNTDFWIEVKKADGEIERWFIEIKPKMKLSKPKPPKDGAPLKDKKRFNMMAKEYLINEAKFAALRAWAEKNGAKFYVFTELELERYGIIGGRFDLKK